MIEKRLFISYGHDNYRLVVERFAREFSCIFSDVFFDESSLKTGIQYDSLIEKAIEQCSVVIYFMTKYSVRVNNAGLSEVDDSFCRDEIEYARSCKKVIIPVMLEDCQPPLIVHRLQYINGKNILHDGLTINEQEYIKTKKSLLATIEDINALTQYGESYSLMRILNQFDNDVYSKSLTRDYKGRVWFSQRCISWIKETNEKVLTIVGDIGSGKTSFVTNLVFEDTDGFFAGIHYCRFDIESSTKVKNIIKSLTYSVATQIDGFSHYIEGVNERLLDTASGTDLFETLLVEPLNKIENRNGRKAVVVIDAIDEISDINERTELIGLLSDNSKYLPSWFKIIITSRPDNKLEYLLQDSTVLKIDTLSTENIQDINDYIDSFLAKHNLSINYSDKKELIEGSGGNFLYVYFALSEILEGGPQIEYKKNYPRGLDGIYARTINRKFKNIDEYESEVVPIFEVLSAVKAPISIDELSKITGEGKRQLISKIQKISAFIHRDNNMLCFYHKSLAEWLVNFEKSDEYYIERKEGEKKIVSWIKNHDNDFTLSSYCMAYGINHLIENKEYCFLNSLLQEKQFIIAEQFSNSLLEYMYRKQFEIIKQVIINICVQPSIMSFVVIRRVVDGAINAGQFDSGFRVIEFQRNIETYEVFYHLGLGNIVLYRSKAIEEAKNHYMEGKRMAEKQYAEKPSIWTQFALSLSNGRMGKIMVEAMKTEEAMSYYRSFLELSLDLYQRTSSVEVLRNVAIGYERIGWIFQSKNAYADASNEYYQCLIESQKIYEETKTIEALRGVSITYERLGRVAEMQGDYKQASEFYMNNFTMSEEIYSQIKSLNSKRGLANSCHCLGDSLIGQSRYAEAYRWFLKDKQISSEIYTVTDMIDDTRDFAICLDRLAFIRDKQGKKDEAETMFTESVDLYLSLVEKTKTKKLITECLIEFIRIAEFYCIHNLKERFIQIDKKVNLFLSKLDITEELKKLLEIYNSIAKEWNIQEYSFLCNRRNTK